MDPEAFIEDYGSAIEAGQASVLIGAGLSVGAGYPEWDELLEPVAAEFEVPTMADLPLRAQYIENQCGGRTCLSEHVATAIGAVAPEPLENHILSGLFVSGSARTLGNVESTGSDTYPTAASDEQLDRFAEVLGCRLADEEVPSIVAAGELGDKVGYSFLSRLDPYDPRRFLLVRRRSDEEVGPPSLRQGQMQFIGQEPDMLRSAAFERVRAVVVLGGGPGTESEASRALELGMTVVPVAHTGGAAHKIWRTMSDNLRCHRVGQRPIDPQRFNDLASADFDVAMQAATGLIRVGLFLPRKEGR